MNRKLLCELVERVFECTVSEAGDGEAALAEAVAKLIDAEAAHWVIGGDQPGLARRSRGRRRVVQPPSRPRPG